VRWWKRALLRWLCWRKISFPATVVVVVEDRRGRRMVARIKTEVRVDGRCVVVALRLRDVFDVLVGNGPQGPKQSQGEDNYGDGQGKSSGGGEETAE